MTTQTEIPRITELEIALGREYGLAHQGEKDELPKGVYDMRRNNYVDRKIALHMLDASGVD